MQGPGAQASGGLAPLGAPPFVRDDWQTYRERTAGGMRCGGGYMRNSLGLSESRTPFRLSANPGRRS